MKRTIDLYAPDFPHGTVEGYRAGCHGSVCGGVVACRDVYTRYQGDWGFKKLIDAGESAAEIIAREDVEREAVRQRDREAARAERRRELAARKPPRPRKVGRPRAPRTPRETALDTHGAQIEMLHAEGLNDAEIAARVGLNRATVGKIRRARGLDAITRVRTPKARGTHRPRVDRRADVARLHAQGLTDEAVAAELGIAPTYAGTLRRGQGLPANRIPRPPRTRRYQPRYDRRPDVAAAHADGLTDRQIGERLGISHSEVGRLRRDLGLEAHRAAPWRKDPATLMPHGTNASYARGCRCEACHQAQREYYREWQRKKRAQSIPAEHHGTPYGYQLGCRGRKACPADTSCTDAMLEEDRRRRRAAGVPEASPRVPAEPVREHVRALIEGGRSVLGIAEEAGVSKTGLKVLLYGRSGARKGEFPSHIEAEKADRLLALEVTR